MKEPAIGATFVPRVAVWEITRRCNLRCAHCGTGAGEPRAEELTLSECVDLIHQLAALGNRVLTLSGGEPTLRPDWPQIGQAAADAGIQVNMVTNGQTDTPEELASQVREAGLANVGVSIDGLERTHDQLRCSGAFAQAVRTVETLTRAGIWVDVMMTVNQLNLVEVPEVYQLAQRLGAQGLRVQLGKPMGNQTLRHDLTLEPRHLLTLLPQLGHLAHCPGPVVRVGDSVGYYSPWDRELRTHDGVYHCWNGCLAGKFAIGLQSDGSVKGCLSLQPHEGQPDTFVEGNIRQHSLAQLWNRPGAFAYTREFDPESLYGGCSTCTRADLCRGGASCVAHAFTGRLGHDPMCYLQVMRSMGADRRRSWTQAAATAAMLLTLGVGGCATEHTPRNPGPDGGNVTPPDGAVATDGGLTRDGAQTTDSGPPAECGEVDCECFMCPEYGVNLPCSPCATPADYRACCCEDVACENPCPECDYGIWPPNTPQFQVCCGEDEA